MYRVVGTGVTFDRRSSLRLCLWREPVNCDVNDETNPGNGSASVMSSALLAASITYLRPIANKMGVSNYRSTPTYFSSTNRKLHRNMRVGSRSNLIIKSTRMTNLVEEPH